MNIFFIGTGGGRVNLLAQLRSTGGFIINGSLKIYVDPGPGALYGSKLHKIDLSKMDILVVTHNQIDHHNDAEKVMEAMSNYALQKRGALVASKSVLQGGGHFDPSISRYHQEKMQQVICGVPKQRNSILCNGKNADFSFTPVKHDDETGFGFVLSMDGSKIGYTSDSEYFEGLGGYFKGCDYLIVNNLKAEDDGIPDHMDSGGCIKLLKEAKPKTAILAHFGMKLINSMPELEAQKIASKSGVKTIAARDGASFGDGGVLESKKSLLDFVQDDENIW